MRPLLPQAPQCTARTQVETGPQESPPPSGRGRWSLGVPGMQAPSRRWTRDGQNRAGRRQAGLPGAADMGEATGTRPLPGYPGTASHVAWLPRPSPPVKRRLLQELASPPSPAASPGLPQTVQDACELLPPGAPWAKVTPLLAVPSSLLDTRWRQSWTQADRRPQTWTPHFLAWLLEL